MSSGRPIHAGITTPEEVLSFWFAGRPADASLKVHERRWFGVDPGFDSTIRHRFGETLRAAVAGELNEWANSASGRLALIILMDQLTRNAFRGSAAAYSLDREAVRLCHDGIRLGIDRSLSPVERLFFYLPLLHSELLSDQQQGVQRLAQLRADTAGSAAAADFAAWLRLARRHRRTIRCFGRFPHRNAILGRDPGAMELGRLFYRRLLSRVVTTLRRPRRGSRAGQEPPSAHTGNE